MNVCRETQVRMLLVAGILLSLAAYLLFLGIGEGWWLILPSLVAVASLAVSFYGLSRWHGHQVARRAERSGFFVS